MLTCPLLDLENKRCVVYEVRPWVCRQYGRVAGLKCRYNPHVKFKSKEEAAQDIDNYMARINKDPFGGFAGFMAMDIGWPQLEGDV